MTVVLLLKMLLAAAMLHTSVVLRLALVIASLIGPTGIRVFTQIMRRLIAAIAVEFSTQGLAAIFPGWQ